MSPPGKRNARAEGPGAEIATATKQFDHQQDNRNERSVRGHRALIFHRSFHSVVWTGSAQVSRVLKGSVPSLGRDYDHADKAYVVYRSRVPALLEAFKAAGVEVNELGGDR